MDFPYGHNFGSNDILQSQNRSNAVEETVLVLLEILNSDNSEWLPVRLLVRLGIISKPVII